MRIDSRHGIKLGNICSLPFVMYDVQKLKAWIDILHLKRVKLFLERVVLFNFTQTGFQIGFLDF